ncbi:endocuticle structural glycoprotein SgAbd-8 [Chrysoperla carnea]|uniref:endocuticle structural glycoprotein SgAbd-8 n=1 Tax=Chrysoperla carnea TaxID=189513 RepID=UPI001D079147|nr:endocuticle structural glycoprotein SgAbd-8 [Chrysoperla carnea]
MNYLILLCLCATVFAQRPLRPQQPQQQQQQQQNYDDNDNYQPLAQPSQQKSAQQNYVDTKYRETTTYIPIIRFNKEQENDGSYKTSYETGNNIIAEETGFLKEVPARGDEKEPGHAQVQHGSYSYTAPNGEEIVVEYTADENGFRPIGQHLPTPPPVSPEVQKGLDLIYAGIKAQQEAAARNPENAKDFLNNPGFYRGE